MIERKEITWDNFWEIVNLRPAEAQQSYLQPNAVYLAMAYVNLKYRYPEACFGLYHGEIPVGFAKINFVPQGETVFGFSEDCYFIDALMIDHRFQGKGYGKAALQSILSFAATKPWREGRCVRLSCYDENTAAIALYESFGFVRSEEPEPGRENARYYTLWERGAHCAPSTV